MYSESFEKENHPSTFEGNVKVAYEAFLKFFQPNENFRFSRSPSFRGEGIDYRNLSLNTLGSVYYLKGKWHAHIAIDGLAYHCEDGATPEASIETSLQSILYDLDLRIGAHRRSIELDEKLIKNIEDQILQAAQLKEHPNERPKSKPH
jgi:hypothetical protein